MNKKNSPTIIIADDPEFANFNDDTAADCEPTNRYNDSKPFNEFDFSSSKSSPYSEEDISNSRSSSPSKQSSPSKKPGYKAASKDKYWKNKKEKRCYYCE